MSNEPFKQRLFFDQEMTLNLPNTGPTLIGTLTNNPVAILFKNQTTVTGFLADNPGSTATITGITTGATTTITAANSFSVGQFAFFYSVGGTTELNGNTYMITAASPTQFTVNATTSNAWTAGGIALVSKGTTMVSGEEIILDCRANHGIASNMSFSKGTTFYFTAIGGTGAVRISLVYAK